MSLAGYMHPRVHALIVMITSHKIYFGAGHKSWNLRAGFTGEMYTGISKLHISSLWFTLCKIYWFVLCRKGLMARSMNMLLSGKIYPPSPCVCKNYHKYSNVSSRLENPFQSRYFSHWQPYVIIHCFIDPVHLQFNG